MAGNKKKSQFKTAATEQNLIHETPWTDDLHNVQL